MCARPLKRRGALAGERPWLACPLSIDREQDRVLGECDEISAGLERSVVLEYFVLIDGALLVLAQQGGRIDLTSVEEPRQNVVIQPALATRRCLGNLNPAEINFSVCDNDGDGMENLAEYCNEEREPLIAEQSGEPLMADDSIFARIEAALEGDEAGINEQLQPLEEALDELMRSGDPKAKAGARRAQLAVRRARAFSTSCSNCAKMSNEAATGE